MTLGIKSLVSHHRLYKIEARRLQWKQMAPREATGLVKGTQRRIIVVKPPDTKMFEEAIFVVKDEYLKNGSASAEDILKEAGRAAEAYVRAAAGRKRRLSDRIPKTFYAAAGAALAGIAWLTAHFAGV